LPYDLDINLPEGAGAHGSGLQQPIKTMKKLKKILWVAACAVALGLGAGKVQAQQQGRGNFDPAQMRQDMLDRYKERMEVKDDSEWKLIEASITKVMDAQREVMADRMRGMFGGQRRNRGGDTNNVSTASDNNSRRSRIFGTPSPEAEDLQKAIDDKASADVIKAKLAKLREAAAAKEAKLTQAQDELKALLTSRQEAIAVLGGLLK
jgi:hypothetical protein